MADVEKIYRITSDSSSINKVRRYTASEREAKMKMMEEEIKEHKEMLDIRREIKEKYPNPEKLSFSELLEQEMNGEKNKPIRKEDEEGFILDIKSV